MSSIYDKSSLVLIPSGTKTGKVYSQKPVSGDGDFTFTRASAATRVNADGNIEKETQNLLLQSNSFDTTWTKTGSTLAGGQSDKDGGTDAWKLTSSNTGQSFVKQVISSSGVVTCSVYAKAGTANFIALYAVGGGDPRTFFDLQNGTTETSGNNITNDIEDIGGGWYRCSLVFDKTITDVRLYIADSDNVFNSGNGSSIYIQDAQLNQGLIAQEVITTTTAAVYGGITDNTPRLDYTDSSCPALLLEPLRTNLIEQSEYFGAWSAFGGAVLTHNDAVSPEGISNAVKFSNNGVFKQYATAANTDYVFSVFAKTDTATAIAINYVDQTAPYRGGTITYTFATDSVAVTLQSENNSVTADREDYGNGWIRVIIKFKTNVNKNYNYQQIAFSGGSGWVYGAQLEAGSYATSYIPTYGSSVTRVVDDCDAVSATSLIGQSEGTLFLDFVANDEDSLQIIYQVRTTGSTNVGQIDFRIQSGNLRVLGNDAGTTQFNISAGAAVAGTRYKCAVRYANNNVAFYVNGVLKGSDTNASFSSSSLDQITFNENGTTFYPSVNVNQALIIPTALPNTELADLTTL